MKDDILSYREMCDKESVQTLQRGMNFRFSPSYSLILMSQRKNAPYNDEVSDDGTTIYYEGHDSPKTEDTPEPKKLDQPLQTKNGTLTQNGKFVKAIEDFRTGSASEKVRVYEKLFSGVWSFKGLFELVDYSYEKLGSRKVFKFKFHLTEETENSNLSNLRERSRIIPTEVKKTVWERDGGKCVICGAKDELHFDHDIPFSKGGTSISAGNVRILCARHNLSKSDNIE
jgi:hypothetical protein